MFGQSASEAALPEIYAAVGEGVDGGDYIGPSGSLGMKEPPVKARSSKRSCDTGLAKRLWTVSEELTGVRFLN